jgi:hypothetical protein
MIPFRPSGLAALLLLCAALLAGPTTLLAAEPSPAELRKIEALIAHIERLEEARFVRNGTAYDARTAGYFLRRKWESRRSRVTSAEDFIAQVASGSSTTGAPYLIRFPDGREVPCGDYLRAELRRLGP